jgi:LmbE family N-acetylglucosaminyl deacetylase
MTRDVRATLLLCLAVGLPLFTPSLLSAQAPSGRSSFADAALLMRQLDGVKRVLMIAAHPDDEDSSLLAALSRGWGAETAYLSLTRGDGGQNLIGPELGEGLGVIRTGELVAARRLDGGEQFFTRAFDFGYSKSAQEAIRFWAEDDVLADAVWIIRTFRPHVIISQWSGTPQDGHGQHQASGIIAHEAFRAAADPARFPEQLTEGVGAWQTAKLYRGLRRLSEGEALTLPTGTFDPLLGRSHFQLGMASRSMHRSQDMGVRQWPGPRATTLELVAGPRTGSPHSLFSGIDTTLIGLVGGVEGEDRVVVERHLQAYRDALTEARATLDPSEPWRAAVALGRALGHLRSARSVTTEMDQAPSELGRVLRRKEELVQAALMAAAGVTLEVRVDDDLLVPGEDVTVHVELWNGGELAVTGAMPQVHLPRGWTLRWAEEGELGTNPSRFGFFGGAGGTQHRGAADVPSGSLARWSVRVTVPADAQPSRQFYLVEPRDGAMYRWPEDRSLWGLPLNPPELTATVRADFSHPEGLPPLELNPRVAARYVGVDRTTGEFRRPVLVVPAVSVAMDPPGMVWPIEVSEARSVTVVVANEAASGSSGSVALELPAGWTAEPARHPFSLDVPGASRSFTFQVAPAGSVLPGQHVFRAVATTQDGNTYSEGVRLLDYPHIDRVALFHPAEALVSAFSARVTEGLSIGYVMGSGDSGPEALRQLGLEVEEMGPEDVRSGSFPDYDVIVLGVRAYETRPDLAAANEQLLEFVRAGGTVVAQYNQFEFTEGGYGPYPIQISRDRVSEEDAAVAVLDPAAPVLLSPNRIGPEDFDGWVQERGLYFPREWDERYHAILSMADTDEEPKAGSLLVASVGDGVYVYASLSFFRQFATGVPGAYRLFANLVSLRPRDWREHISGVGDER